MKNLILGQIKQDQLKARKEKDKLKIGALTALMGEVSIIGINNGHRETTDIEAIKVITKFLKGANENLTLMSDSVMEAGAGTHFVNRLDQIKKEISIYENYLPKQMTEDEIAKAIGLFMGDNSDVNMGQVMGYLKKNFDGQFDGKMASNIVKNIIK